MSNRTSTASSSPPYERIHADSRQTHGAPRLLAGMRLGLGVHLARKRVARLTRLDGLVGVSQCRQRRGWKPNTARHENDALFEPSLATDLNVGYVYDAAGNVTSLIDAPTRGGGGAAVRDAQCFQYDGLRRLQTAWTDADANCARSTVTASAVGGVSPYWNEYEYDKLGNRTQKTTQSGSTATVTTYQHGEGDAGPHQLTSQTVTTGGVSVTTGYLWDAAGNQTSRTVDGDLQTQTWDAEGELVSTSTGQPGSGTSNVYDANGTRLIRTDSTGVTVFLPGGQEVRSTDTTMSATRWYSFGGTTVAVRTGTGFGGVSSIVSDAHGTPLAQVNNTSLTAPVTMIRTDPFGAPRAGQTGTVAGRGFLGAPADASGLTLLGARYYDPGTGTFLSVDPELSPGNPAQFNAYVYSGNNPVTWADPTGRNWWNDVVKNVGKGLKTAGKWIHDNRAVITGVVVGVALTAGCMALTAGVGTVGCAVLGGMAGGAVTNVMTQAQSKKKFNVGSLVTDTLIGGAFGLLGPAAGALGKAIAPAASAVARTISNAVKPALSKAPTAFRPAATGGLKPSGAATGKLDNAASCAINSFVPRNTRPPRQWHQSPYRNHQTRRQSPSHGPRNWRDILAARDRDHRWHWTKRPCQDHYRVHRG